MPRPARPPAAPCLLPLLLFTAACRGEYYKSDLKEKDPDYGKTWMYFPDGNGEPQVVNLTEPPPEQRGRLFADQDDLISFYLYTRRNPKTSKEIFLDQDEVKTGNDVETLSDFFQSKNDVKIVIHGWMSSGDSTTCLNIKDAYLDDRDCNVIVVDWEPIAANFFYFVSARNTKVVGRKTARLVDFLVKNYGVDPAQVHIIGHSLGAHVSGYAGSAVTGTRVGRITGLDPASPGFEYVANNEDRLDESDAQFVDVVHTCGGVLGFYGTLGHVDFYPNGGTACQPGCGGLAQIVEACSHGRAHEYFAESIRRPEGFRARACQGPGEARAGSCRGDWGQPMGDATPSSARGVYYLETNPEQPYAANLD